MLLFRSKEDALASCVDAGSPLGAILTLDETWEFATRWYGDRLSPAFHGRTVEQTREIFQALSLSSPFWDAPAPHA